MSNILNKNKGTLYYTKQFIKDFIMHYTPLIVILKTMFGHNTTSYLGASIFSAVTFEIILRVLNLPFLGVPVFFGIIIIALILVDWWVGTAASIKISKVALLENNTKLYEEKRFNKSKIIWVMFKFMSLFLWMLLAYAVNKIVEGIEFASGFFNIITIIPILLFGYKEFISIGNHIETLTKKKPYLCKLAERLFEITEIKFLNRF